MVYRIPTESFALTDLKQEMLTSENVPELVHLGSFVRKIGNDTSIFHLARKSDGVSVIQKDNGSVQLSREKALDEFEPV